MITESCYFQQDISSPFITHPAHKVATHQGGHSKADDLDTAVIVPLRFEVSVVTCVTPGHGPCTVPAEK